MMMTMLAAMLVARPAEVPNSDASFRIGIGAGVSTAATGIDAGLAPPPLGLGLDLSGGGELILTDQLLLTARADLQPMMTLLGPRISVGAVVGPQLRF